MSELTDAYMQGWSAGWNMSGHAHRKAIIELIETIKCGNEPERCDTPEHCDEVDDLIRRVKEIDK